MGGQDVREQPLAAGLIKDRYEPLSVLGAGGEGRVVKALDHQHDRFVALKIREVREDVAREDLLNEARVLLSLPPHPALPMVREDFFDGDRYVVAMDWVEGIDLAALLRERGRPGLAPSSVLAYLAQAAEALTHLHSQDPPVIHGDIKPANLILAKGGHVKVVDFGLSSAPYAPRHRAGTPGYRAPELAADATPSRASDVYALAATAFALLTGAPPTGVLPSWEGIDTAQAGQLEDALRAGLASDPARRPATPGELVERLRTGWGDVLPTGVMTFCLSDIEGSTALWEASPAAMAEALVRHDEIIAAHVEARGGRVLKSMGEGDSTVSVFESAPPALEAAVAATRALREEPWPDGLSIAVRFGIHTGEAERRGADYFGTTLNLAARLRGQADGGQVFLSSATLAVVGAHLPQGCETVDLGPHRLRGLRAPESIHALKGPGVTAPPPAHECPYRGLLAFEPADRRTFFGRDGVVAEVLARLAPGRLTAVVGASGSGKSSVLRAGVVAAVEAGELEGIDVARIVTPGAEPELDVSGGDRELVVVDQFEELYTLCGDRAARDAFLDRLLGLASPVLIGVRADLYGRLSEHPALARAVAENQVLLGAMTVAELERAITGPAEVGGLRLEPGLVELILRDVAREPGALPLLSHALRVTWERRDGRTLTVDGYRASGGVASALAQTADAVVDSVPPDRHALMRELFVRLTELGEGIENTRRRVARDELVLEGGSRGEIDAILERLAEARLVTLGENTAEVAHEVLIREWPRLRAWLEEDREGIRLHRQLSDAARLWDAGGRDPADLYRGARLAGAVEWVHEHPASLNATERAFLDAAVEESDRERRNQLRANRRLRVLLAGVGALAAVAGVAGAQALRERAEAREQAVAADAQRLGAQALTDNLLDHGLLLARAGVALDDSVATRSNLLAALLRNPAAIGVLHGDGDRLVSATLSRDGKLLAVGDNNGTVTVFDTAARAPVGHAYQMPENGRVEVRFSADGALIAVAGPTTVDVLDARGGRRVGRVRPGGYPGSAELPEVPLSASIVPGGREVVIAHLPASGPGVPAQPSYLQRADIRTGRLLGRPRRLAGAPDGVQMLASPDGETLYLQAGERGTAAIESRTLRLRRRIPLGGFTTAVSRNERSVALGGLDGSVRVGDARTGRIRRLSGRHEAGVQRAVFAPGGETLVTTGDDSRVIVWDLRRGEIRETLTGHSGRVLAAAVSVDGRTLYTAGLDSSVIVWDLAGDRRLGRPFVASAGLHDSPPPLAISPDGRTVAFGEQDGSVVLRDAETLRRTARFRGVPEYAAAVRFSPDGRLLAVTGMHGTVTIWDARSRQRVASLRGLRMPSQALDFSPDGALLAAADGDGVVKVWDIRSRSQVGGFQRPKWVEWLAFSPDGRRIAVTFEDLGTEIRDVQGRRIAHLPTNEFVRAVAWSPGGRLVATGQFNGEAQLWSTATWKPVGRPLPRHAGFVLTVAFSPDGRLLSTSSTDGTVRLWDVATRKALGTPLPGEENEWVSAAFTPDGKRLFAYYGSGRALRWEISPGTWKRQACSTAGRGLTPREWRDVLPARPFQTICDGGSG